MLLKCIMPTAEQQNISCFYGIGEKFYVSECLGKIVDTDEQQLTKDGCYAIPFAPSYVGNWLVPVEWVGNWLVPAEWFEPLT